LSWEGWLPWFFAVFYAALFLILLAKRPPSIRLYDVLRLLFELTLLFRRLRRG
jgi:hypothetical protein